MKGLWIVYLISKASIILCCSAYKNYAMVNIVEVCQGSVLECDEGFKITRWVSLTLYYWSDYNVGPNEKFTTVILLAPD